MEGRAISRGLLAALLAWLVPGAGHFYVGARGRAVVFFLLVLVTVGAGAAFDGNFSVTDYRTPFLSKLQVGSNLALGPVEPLLRTAFYGAPVYKGDPAVSEGSIVNEVRFAVNAAVARAAQNGLELRVRAGNDVVTVDPAQLPDGELIRDGQATIPIGGRTRGQFEIDAVESIGPQGNVVTAIWDTSAQPPIVRRLLRAYRPWSAYGSAYLMAAGLMNLLLIFDAWDIGIGRKP